MSVRAKSRFRRRPSARTGYPNAGLAIERAVSGDTGVEGAPPVRRM